jgi:hypothetical protein
MEICLALNINEKTLISARMMLINAGLVYYKSGKSKRMVSLYSFSKPVETTVNNTVDTPVNTPANVPANTPTNTPDLFKGKTKTKTKTNPSLPPLQGGNVGDEKSWKDDFEIYKSNLRDAFVKFQNNQNFVDEQERYHPGLNIRLSIEKACLRYWSKEAGWKRQKASQVDIIDWKTIFSNTLDVKTNHVWLQKGETNGKQEETNRLPAYY